MITEQLRTLKARCGLTAQDIADKSGVPISTVQKVLSGTTESPTFSSPPCAT